jgi:MoaA/NifB/PqqE/SkfB family radical SAM enzyme
MRLADVETILHQAKTLGTVEWIYFEGGEPFLYHPLLARGVALAADAGFRVGIVTNGYWATSREDARIWLEPFRGKLDNLSISDDAYHFGEDARGGADAAVAAANDLDIPTGVICVAQPEALGVDAAVGTLPAGDSAVMYRGRAAVKLAHHARQRPWIHFTQCPHEDLRDPGRVHVDPLGYLHICQGISIGNLVQTPLTEICERYDPETHPVCGPLLEGGPAELTRRYGVEHRPGHADACHLCYETRRRLRSQFQEVLTPQQMYG